MRDAHLRGFDREVRLLIRDLVTRGWSARVTGRGHAVMQHPTGQTMTLPPSLSKTNRGHQNAMATIERIERTARTTTEEGTEMDLEEWPEAQATLIAGAALLGWDIRLLTNGGVRLSRGTHAITLRKSQPVNRRTERQLKDRIAKYGDIDVLAIAAAHETMDRDAIVDLKFREALEKIDSVEQLIATPRPPRKVSHGETPAREVVAEAPWRAHKGTVRGQLKTYESAAVVQRTWSDGSVDYACAAGCGWSADKPRSVSNHYGQQHTISGDGVPWQEARDATTHVEGTAEDVGHRPYQPRPTTVAALMAVLEELAERDDCDMEMLARAALVWVHERRDLSADERGELTDAEVLARIRSLVESSALAHVREESEALRSALAESAAEADALRTERDAALRERDEVRSSLSALAEMARSVL